MPEDPSLPEREVDRPALATDVDAQASASNSRAETQAQSGAAWTPSTPDSLLGLAGAEQRVIRDSIKARLFPGLGASGSTSPSRERTTSSPRIGRFTVLRRLGEGGMGVVFVAFDEELDRKVAIKLLRGRGRDEGRGRARLMREAQALARLSHPNVVQVHEVGELEGEVYVAMEFVPGQTLRKWLETPRTWREIVAVLVQAGAGLRAAHDKGLVHRDFKPDNVMVGDDGRVRVLDFGLVRANEASASDEGDPLAQTFEEERGVALEHDEDDADEGDHRARGELRRALQTPLTRTGAVMGTPVYMAPEQHEGEAADAFGDQFAFCVTAYEALFGRRPFPNGSLIELIEAMRSGAVRPVPRDTPVPRRIREAVLRGLSADRAARWPSLGELLGELDGALSGRSRVWAIGGTLLMTGVLAGAVRLSMLDEPAPPVCSIEASALEGVWDARRRAGVEQALASTGVPHASTSAAEVVELLDAWSEGWIAAQRDACEATEVHRVQSSAVLERRQACLAGQAREVAGLVGVFERADARVLAEADSLLRGLPAVSDCVDPDVASEVSPELRERVATIERQIGEAKALLHAGKLDEAEASIEEITRATAGVSHPQTELRARALVIALEWERQPSVATIEAWRALAGEARLSGLDALEAELRQGLAVRVTGRAVESPARERWLIADAELALAARDEGRGARALELGRARAQVLEHEGRYEEAREEYVALLREVETAGGWADLAPLIRQGLANVEAALGQDEQAENDYRLARSRLVERWGPMHPAVLAIDVNLALQAMERGEFEVAASRLAAVRAGHEVLFGEGSLEVARDRVAQASLALRTGELKRAKMLAEAALAVIEREVGPTSDEAARVIELLGAVLYFEGDLEGSLAAYDRALSIYDEVLGPGHVQVGLLHGNRGDTLLALGRPSEARAAHERSLSVLQRELPEDHPSLALPLAGRGEAWLALGQAELAVEDLERALALLDPSEPSELAETQFALARALTALGREPERCRDLVERARASFEQLGLTAQLETLDRWLAR